MAKQVVHFLHVGKTGGSAIKAALTGHLETGDCRICLHPHDYSLMDVPVGEKAVFFVRDPISRFVSGFYSRQRKGQPRYFSPWSEGEALAFDRFRTPNELALALTASDQKTRQNAHAAMESIEHVRNHYSDWFRDEAFLRSRLPDMFFIGRQETLSEDFARLKLLLGLGELAQLPARNAEAAHGNSPHLDKHLDEEAVRNLLKWYASDYAFLGVLAEIARHINCRLK